MKNHENTGPLMSSVVGFMGLFAVMIVIAICKETGVINHEVAKRSIGILLGVMLIAVGNLLPKFHLFDSPRRDPAQTLATERFAGWVFVIAGATYAIIWLWTPMPQVILLSSFVGLGAFLLVAVDWLRRGFGSKPSTATRKPTGTSFDKRLLLGTMLLTLGWGVAMFLADYIWGDTFSHWAAIAFIALLTLGGPLLLATRPPLDN